MRKTAAGIFLCLILAGCGDDTTSGTPTAAPSPTTAAAKPTGPVENPNADAATTFTANPAITNAHPIPFQSWTRVGDRAVAVHFTVGSPECYGVNATATETADTVTIELRSGTLPEAVGKMCSMIAIFGTLDVPLQAPLGDRTVVSAAK